MTPEERALEAAAPYLNAQWCAENPTRIRSALRAYAQSLNADGVWISREDAGAFLREGDEIPSPEYDPHDLHSERMAPFARLRAQLEK